MATFSLMGEGPVMNFKSIPAQNTEGWQLMVTKAPSPSLLLTTWTTYLRAATKSLSKPFTDLLRNNKNTPSSLLLNTTIYFFSSSVKLKVL